MSVELALKMHDFLAPYQETVFTHYALAVHHHGERVIAGGWRAPQFSEPGQLENNFTTLFDFASLTKLFTTTAFLSLVSAGKTSLDAPLVSVIPEFGAQSPRPIEGGQDPHTKQRLPTPPERVGETVDPSQVTFFHLLTHTSGLPPWRDIYNAAGDAPRPPGQTDPVSRSVRWARALEALCACPFVAQPGEAVRYSDIGLMLLGEAVSRLHGTPGELDRAIQARVLDPLGLKTVTFRPLDAGHSLNVIAPTEMDSTWRQRRVWGEVHDENACGVGGVAGHAGLFGTAADLAAFGQAWLTETIPGVDRALIRQAVSEQAVTEGERRGIGWMLPSLQGSSAGDLMSRSAYGHTGFTGTSLWIDPSQALVVAALTNRVYFGRETEPIYKFRRALHDHVWTRLCL